MLKKESMLFRGRKKVSAFDYNPLYGMITIELEDGKEKICICDIEEVFIKGKKREELQLESITVRKKKRTGSERDFYYNIKLQFCNEFKLLVRGNINIDNSYIAS